MERVLSGLRPTGKIHLGHYFGVLTNFKKLQEEFECYFFVADIHALTTNYSKTKEIGNDVIQMLADWLAVGIDPDKATIFIQSAISEHAELHTMLSMITPLGWLERVPSYKEKIDEEKETDLHTYGFLGYPVLMASDILIYKAHKVPIGADQIPHLELTREISRRFNHLYKEIFPEPQPLLTISPKVPGLDNRKMSKSYDNSIYLSDPPDIVTDKILHHMVTDPQRIRRTDKGNPDVCPVYDLHKLLTPKDKLEYIDTGCRSADIGCIGCKKIVIEEINALLAPIREKREQLLQHPNLLKDIVEHGNNKAKTFASQTLKEVKEAIGLNYEFGPSRL
ncbi:MAG: tryptophan--tRNA ligase [Deltaproteobacteria bacterium]|nr:tryptophan--tRNA ligase [Deltaproteobacteria bacterium]MCL5791546.1 tryptophan--tRNA ligase [Deltaproteobacteria bacterium]